MRRVVSLSSTTNARVPGNVGATWLLSRHRRHVRKPGGEVEDTAQSQPALDPDPSAHQLGQLAADGQPQARAAEAARQCRIDLLKGLKDPGQLRVRDANARIADRELQVHLAVRARRDASPQDHLTPLRELQCVADQVHDHLAQSPGVADEDLGNIRMNVAGDFEIGVARAMGQAAQGVAQALAQLERLGLQFELAGLDFGKVQDVVDDVQQGLAGLVDHLEEFRLPLLDSTAQQQLGHPDDGVQRRADFVAHVRHEIALGLVGRLGCRLGLVQLQLGLFAHRGVACHRVQQTSRAPPAPGTSRPASGRNHPGTDTGIHSPPCPCRSAVARRPSSSPWRSSGCRKSTIGRANSSSAV